MASKREGTLSRERAVAEMKALKEAPWCQGQRKLEREWAKVTAKAGSSVGSADGRPTEGWVCWSALGRDLATRDLGVVSLWRCLKPRQRGQRWK